MKKPLIYAALRTRFSADKGLIPKPSKSRFYCVTGMQQRSDEAMAVFRVERNKGYTVMSNHHLRNKELSLKAKGLLSQMLSLPLKILTISLHRQTTRPPFLKTGAIFSTTLTLPFRCSFLSSIKGRSGSRQRKLSIFPRRTTLSTLSAPSIRIC